MLNHTPRTLCLGLAASLAFAGLADAQCTGCAQPTVAYSPVVAQPYTAAYAAQPAVVPQQPLVLQQTPVVADPWYPGKLLGRVITAPFRAVDRLLTPAPVVVPQATQPTFVTAAYRPTFPPNYNYATFAAAPSVQTVARPVTLVQTPTYQASPACCTDPCGGAGFGGGVVNAGFAAPIDTGCSSCSGGSAITSPGNAPITQPVQPINPSPGTGFNGALTPTPTPAIPPGANVSPSRVNRPETPGEGSVMQPPVDGASDDATSWWDAPQLFDARDRSANRPQANVWPAVYQQPAPATAPSGYRQTAYRPNQQPAAAPQRPARNKQVGASGWRSAD
ncbi:MAG: hypothetical protein AAGJ46_21450 [Planctomycetota bacterium]